MEGLKFSNYLQKVIGLTSSYYRNVCVIPFNLKQGKYIDDVHLSYVGTWSLSCFFIITFDVLLDLKKALSVAQLHRCLLNL